MVTDSECHALALARISAFVDGWAAAMRGSDVTKDLVEKLSRDLADYVNRTSVQLLDAYTFSVHIDQAGGVSVVTVPKEVVACPR